jgi:septal ring-binding cell division protein DamX
VEVPVLLEYPLVQRVLVSQLFTGPDGRAVVLDDGSGCNQILLDAPRLGAENGELVVEAQVDARLGMAMLGSCSELLGWQGRIGVLGRPVVQPGGRSIRFEPRQSWLIDAAGSRISSGRLWEAVDNSLGVFFQRFTLDFSPPMDALATSLPAFLPGRSARQLEAILASLALGELAVAPAGLEATIEFDIERLEQADRPEAPLSPEELAQWQERWQMMDALLVLAVKQYAAATDLRDLRGALLDVLIDSRYRLREALAATPAGPADPVRTWFLESWEALRPVLRAIALEQPGQEYLVAFSVLSATDALRALDQLGPGIGLDISADGLRRLARLINAGQGEALLRYTGEIDPELQRLFREQFQPAQPEPSAWRLDLSPVQRAWAGTAVDKLNRWAPRREELDHYLPTVAQLLEQTTAEVLKKFHLDREYRELFRKLVLATAWQESCWRQYVVRQEKLVPLRSGTGDVGLMQVNERVWRGFYDVQQLRWDIGYNSGAGAEVLLDYLVKYALKQGEHQRPGGEANLARASYSAYNGGPRQVSRYRRADVPPELRRIDAAFWEKYRQVDAGRELHVATCLGGTPPAAGSGRPGGGQPGDAADERTAVADGASPGSVIAEVGARWVQDRPGDHFTLQFGAFSTPESASRLIREQSIPAPVYVFPVQRDGTTRYLVLHGSFATREAAASVRERFGHLEPWLRRFGDLQRPR